MARVFLIVMDSVGIGGAEDAEAYGDAGADTIGHIAEACARGDVNRAGLREGPLHLPFLSRLGLREACHASSGKSLQISGYDGAPQGLYGFAVETSKGKDTVSGHWEIAGAPANFAFGYFRDETNSFPRELIVAVIKESGIPGILGDCHASGTVIIDELGAEHIKTGKPIFYTSADSVLQIAAHEKHFGLERLYELCRITRRWVDPLKIGRVIARPFMGDAAQGFKRTGNRKDFAMPPPMGNLLDRADAAKRDIISIGKIGDIFTHRATGREVKASGNMALFDAMLEVVPSLHDGGLLFANFVDFDSEFGHRRDVAGYAAALEAFDKRLTELDAMLKPDDLVLITADHGNDPTWHGTDHTREHVPILGFGPNLKAQNIGRRETFADIGESAAAWLGLPKGRIGTSFR
jgi:phosphopentomutase